MTKGSEQSDSLPPVETGDRMTVEDEALTMQKGKGPRLAIFAVVAVVVLVGGLQMLRQMDAEQGFADVGSEVGAVADEYLGTFWTCALPGAPKNSFRTPDQLEAQLMQFSQRYKSGYATKLDKCRTKLDPLGSKLSAMTVPASLKGSVDQMADATQGLRDAVNGYTEYLRSEDFSVDTATPKLESIVTAVKALNDSHGALDVAVKAGAE